MSIAVAACGQGAPERARPTAPRPATDAVRLAPEEPRVLALAPRGASVAIAWDSGTERVVSTPEGRELCRVPHGPEEVLRFASALGDGTAVVSIARGPEFDVLVVDACGASLRPAFARFPLRRVDSMRRASTPSLLGVATAPTNGSVVLTRIRTSRVALEAETTTVDVDDELSREVLAVALDGEAYAVVYRRGTPEDAAGSVVLATEHGVFPIESLHDIGLLESMERAFDVVSIVASFEFDRPRELRFDARGRGIDSRRLEHGATRATGTSSSRVSVEPEPGAVVVTFRDLGGDVLATRRIERPSGQALPVVARDGGGFAVAFTTRADDGWGVRVVRFTPRGELR